MWAKNQFHELITKFIRNDPPQDDYTIHELLGLISYEFRHDYGNSWRGGWVIFHNYSWWNSWLSQWGESREFRYPALIGLPVRLSEIQRFPDQLSLGLLDAFPAELLVLIFNFLDFQSLARISRVSLRGKILVESLPAYRDMVSHVPTILSVLAKTRLIGFHSAALLRQTLRSYKCVSCFSFGSYLFLPTCERACYRCLERNPAFGVTTTTLIQQCFHLTAKHLKKIPIMFPIPEPIKKNPARQLRFVSIKQAKQLAVQVHGSTENVEGHSTRNRTLQPVTNDFFRYLRTTSLEHPGHDIAEQPNSAYEAFNTMAYIPFPYLNEHRADFGRRCVGCLETLYDYEDSLLPADVLSQFSTPGMDMEARMDLEVYRFRHYEEFWEHVKSCYGARKIIYEECAGIQRLIQNGYLS